MRFFDKQKAIETILYLAQKTPDPLRIFHTLYRADKNSFICCGQSIYRERYLATMDGVMPQFAYNLVQQALISSQTKADCESKRSFLTTELGLVLKREPDLDYLSINNVECLDTAYQALQSLTKEELRLLSCEEKSYLKTPPHKPITWEDMILLDLPNGADVWEYLNL